MSTTFMVVLIFLFQLRYINIKNLYNQKTFLTFAPKENNMTHIKTIISICLLVLIVSCEPNIKNTTTVTTKDDTLEVVGGNLMYEPLYDDYPVIQITKTTLELTNN